jgi:hypothetical protein
MAAREGGGSAGEDLQPEHAGSGEDAGDAVGNEAVDGHDNESEGEGDESEGEADNVQEAAAPDKLVESIKVYTGILDEIIERLEGQGDTAGHSQVRKVLELAAEQQAQPQGHATVLVSETHRLLEYWKLQPSDSVLNKMQVEFLQKIQAGRKAAGMRPAGRTRYDMFNNPRPAKNTAEAQSLSTRGMGKVMRYLHAMSRRKLISFTIAMETQHDGHLHLGTSADMDGFHVVMRTQKGYRGHRDLTLHQQQMDSVASLQGVTFDTLTVPDKKSIICCILKVIATNQRRCCPWNSGHPPRVVGQRQDPDVFKTLQEQAQSKFSEEFFQWPDGVPYDSPAHQTTDNLKVLFTAATEVVGNRWPDVRRAAMDLPRGGRLILAALMTAQESVTRDTNADRDADEDAAGPSERSDAAERDDSDDDGALSAKQSI